MNFNWNTAHINKYTQIITYISISNHKHDLSCNYNPGKEIEYFQNLIIFLLLLLNYYSFPLS